MQGYTTEAEELAHRFQFHPATDAATRDAHEFVRAACLDLVHRLNQVVPKGREAALVVTKAEEVMFWANAAIARHGVGGSASGYSVMD